MDNKKSMIEEDNQLYLEMLGMGDIMNPFAGFDSGARKVMNGKFNCQHLSLIHAEPRRIYVGTEEQLAKHDVGVSLPEDGTILKVIPKYRIQRVGDIGICENPSSFIIWEYIGYADGNRVRVIDLLETKNFYEGHNALGFRFKVNNHPLNTPLKKDTKLTSVPTITPEGQYCYGINANIAFMSDPAATEDGAIISESMQRRLTTIQTGSRTVSWGKKYYPLNLYGNSETYKPFPDIGDTIHPSGMVVAMREYDPLFDVVNMTDDMLQFDGIIHDTDKVVYGLPDATVYDITVTKHPSTAVSRIPSTMQEQTEFYSSMTLDMYRQVLDFYDALKRSRGDAFVLGYEFSRVIRDAIAHIKSDEVIRAYGGNGNKSCKFSLGPGQMDEVTINIKYAKEVMPTRAFKLTSTHGGKAVICDVRKDEDMPLTSSGRRADMIMDDASVQARMIPGVLYEQLFNACGDDTANEIRRLMGEGKTSEAWELALRFYKIVAPVSYKGVTSLYTTDEGKAHHLEHICKDGIYSCIPPYSSSLKYETIGKIMKELPLTYGPVTYRTVAGDMVTTKKSVLIGSIYIELLEKIGDTWSSVADARLQHHGLLSKVPPASRYLSPSKQAPVRISGESETRLYLAALGAETTAELHDRSNSPESHKEVCTNILTAKSPSKIKVAVDRNKIPMGGHRGLTVIEHLLNCAGFKFEINLDYYNDDTKANSSERDTK